MAAAYKARLDRLERLVRALPSDARQALDGAVLQQRLAQDYAEGSAGRRALQRDLAELLGEATIAVVDPQRKPLRYYRVQEPEDPPLWTYTLQQIEAQVREALPKRQFDRLWQRLLQVVEGPRLNARNFRNLPDTLRLQPASVRPEVLSAVILAVTEGFALKAEYRDAQGQRTQPCLHPQAILQRGPLPYVFALKDDETTPVRLYALHRFVSAQALPDQPARKAFGFDLNRAIEEGRADFGQGDTLTLELRVRGYLTELLRVCPLASQQRITPEPPGSPFDLHLTARVPSTGALLRWLLAAGDNLEVVGPPALRQVIAHQATQMAGVYGNQSTRTKCRSSSADSPSQR